ncbi:D-alanyl-D-alanine carboxypeptidase family protein [Amaricoccus sp.]|uniref:M15 family metallopeptidase n=1 Tax=Amaricoccus sp. TaxID=1872485 RepID=UPI001B7B6723|nr:M15 family metallopeptidase [Amaricoccus sp.]MBP7002379.1 M15 family metallopeptidase [Amaricoccus sp.]
MDIARSYLGRTFTIDDDDARLRQNGDLMAFIPVAGGFQKIPRGAKVRIAEVRRVETGSKAGIVFGLALGEDGARIGWTSTRNLAGRFVNVTIGPLPPNPNANQFGPNAAWSGGSFVGQVDLAEIVDATHEIERVAMNTLAPYFALCDAADDDGIVVRINSGFRSYGEQKALHDGFVRKLPGFNLAAKPGFSKHQNGLAFDIDVPGGDGNPTYEWLKRRATGFGFVRTVSGEPWHWEHDPARAEAARRAGTFKTPNVQR